MLQVFFWMAEDPCKQPRQLSHKDMKPCVFHKGHDYFQGSELAYLLGILLLVCFPLVVVFFAYLAIKVVISTHQLSTLDFHFTPPCLVCPVVLQKVPSEGS